MSQKQAPKASEGRHAHQFLGALSSYWIVYHLQTSLGLGPWNVRTVGPSLPLLRVHQVALKVCS